MGAEHPLPVVLNARRVFADDERAQRLGQGAGDLGLHIVISPQPTTPIFVSTFT